jgi:hypothetical protein
MHRSHFEVVADVDQRHWWFLAQDAIDFARQRFDNVQFLCGRAPQDLGAAAPAASAMLLMDVLEHVEDDRAVLAPLIESLKPGAIMLITVPADMRLWSEHDEGLLHYRRYDEAMLRRTWRGLPVEPIALTHFCSRLYRLARLERALGRMRKRLLPARRNGVWDMRVPASPLNRMLERTFEGESRVLCDVVSGRRREGYAHGVSLMAVLRRIDHACGGGDAEAGG